jgi:hypothetical protein
VRKIKQPFRVTIEVDDAIHNTYKITVEENARVSDDGNGGFTVETDIHEYRSCGFALRIFGGGGGVVFEG